MHIDLGKQNIMEQSVIMITRQTLPKYSPLSQLVIASTYITCMRKQLLHLTKGRLRIMVLNDSNIIIKINNICVNKIQYIIMKFKKMWGDVTQLFASISCNIRRMIRYTQTECNNNMVKNLNLQRKAIQGGQIKHMVRFFSILRWHNSSLFIFVNTTRAVAFCKHGPCYQ